MTHADRPSLDRETPARSPMRLVLEDGTEASGLGFGAPHPVAGEVVFNTAMTGYVETLTDPSYCGQILVMTYPLAGSYGVPSGRGAGSLARPYESDRIHVQALVVQHYVNHYSHHSAARSLSEWLVDARIPAITGVDTRTLTKRLRERGTMRGWLFPAEIGLEDARTTAGSVDMRKEVFVRVAPPEPIRYEGGDLTIMVVDVGAKDNIIRSLLSRGASVLRVPWHARLSHFAQQAHGVLVGNGPGNPKDLAPLVEQLRGLMQDPGRPIFGICLGNQLLARAAGADTYKLPYGHRSANQPVQDLLTRRCYVTSQNHGYAVLDESLPPDWEPWFVNLNDGTNEGIRSRLHPHLSVQFHPEASPGPQDTGFLFDEFLRLAGAART